MCLISVNRDEEDEVVIPRLATETRLPNGTSVITPIPPAPPLETVYSGTLVPTTYRPSHGQGNYVYDVGTGGLVEAEYPVGGYSVDEPARHYRASDSDYVYRVNDDRNEMVKSKAITIKVGRSHSNAARGHSYSRSHSGIVRGGSISSKTNVVIGPEGDPYVLTHRHRHRRRSGSIERERNVARFSHVDSPEARQVVSGRHSTVSISSGRMAEVEELEPRTSFRYIEPRHSAVRGLESAEMVRRRETEKFAYGGLSEHRRSGSVPYIASTSGHRRSYSMGGGRRSREKFVLADY